MDGSLQGGAVVMCSIKRPCCDVVHGHLGWGGSWK